MIDQNDNFSLPVQFSFGSPSPQFENNLVWCNPLVEDKDIKTKKEEMAL